MYRTRPAIVPVPTSTSTASSALVMRSLRRLHRRLEAGVEVADRLLELGGDLSELVGVDHLQAEQVLDVEHVDRALAVGGDVGRLDLQVEPGQRARDGVQEARPVAAVDLEH